MIKATVVDNIGDFPEYVLLFRVGEWDITIMYNLILNKCLYQYNITIISFTFSCWIRTFSRCLCSSLDAMRRKSWWDCLEFAIKAWSHNTVPRWENSKKASCKSPVRERQPQMFIWSVEICFIYGHAKYCLNSRIWWTNAGLSILCIWKFCSSSQLSTYWATTILKTV